MLEKNESCQSQSWKKSWKRRKKAVDRLGGIDKFIQKGDVVFLKPNFNTADPFPASTDLNFLKIIVKLCYRAQAKMVLVGDSPTMTRNSRKVFEKLNVFKLQELTPAARVYLFDEEKWQTEKIPKGKYLRMVKIPEIVRRADKLIFLPCLKTHKYAEFTGALKLTVGFMAPPQRLALHMRRLQEKIAELNTIFHPNLIIMDARKCFINEGPSSGEIKKPNLILASESRVAIDIEGVKIIQSYPGNSLVGIEPKSLTQIKKAMEIGIA